MGRRLLNLDTAPPLGVLTDVLTCPSGTIKLEPVAYTCFADGTNAYTYFFFIHRGGTSYTWLDYAVVAAGVSAVRLNWTGIALLPGDSLTVLPFTVGTTAPVVNIGYVEVDN